MVVVRKNLTVEKGEARLLEDIRYFLYITNDREMTVEELVFSANDRCNQEHVSGQLKSGVNAYRVPSDGLNSNWAYISIAALAWNVKAWFGLMARTTNLRNTILRMEFKTFVNAFILIPCQIVNTGRKLIYRVLTYSRSLEDFFSIFDCIRRLRFA